MYYVYLSMRHTPMSMYYSAWLQKALIPKGIHIYDGFDRSRDGDFPDDLANQIKACRNLIVILTPETFGQCDDATSWMAHEIEIAIQNNVNIIPIIVGDFFWPQNLPPQISSIQYIDAIELEESDFSYHSRLRLSRGSFTPLTIYHIAEIIKERLQQTQKEEVVFISYNSKDRDQANEVRNMLERNNIPCWMAPNSIPAGENYASMIPSAIEKCKVFLLILSENSQSSVWVSRELDKAINCQRAIIPFQIDEAPITNIFGFYLANCQIISISAYNHLADAYWNLRERVYDILSNKAE